MHTVHVPDVIADRVGGVDVEHHPVVAIVPAGADAVELRTGVRGALFQAGTPGSDLGETGTPEPAESGVAAGEPAEPVAAGAGELCGLDAVGTGEPPAPAPTTVARSALEPSCPFPAPEQLDANTLTAAASATTAAPLLPLHIYGSRPSTEPRPLMTPDGK